MIASPLTAEPLFHVGPAPITAPVVITWGLMAALTVGSALATRALRIKPGPVQAVLELAGRLPSRMPPSTSVEVYRREVAGLIRAAITRELLGEGE